MMDSQYEVDSYDMFVQNMQKEKMKIGYHRRA